MRLFLILPVLVLAACASTSNDVQVPSSEASARATAAEQFPGVNVDAIAACVRGNATDAELVLLAQGGAIATQTTQSIIARPAAVQCLRDSNTGLQEA